MKKTKQKKLTNDQIRNLLRKLVERTDLIIVAIDLITKSIYKEEYEKFLERMEGENEYNTGK